MIGYIYRRADNLISTIIEDVVSINDDSVIGAYDYAKGIDFEILDCFCCDEPFTKIVNDEITNLETGDTLEVGTVLNKAQRIKILSKLSELDNIIPRYIEDIVEQGLFNLHESKVSAITQKQLLRQQLQELGV